MGFFQISPTWQLGCFQVGRTKSGKGFSCGKEELLAGTHIVPGQMYPFRTAMQLILFANKKGTLAVFHDPLWAYFYVEELII